MTIALWMLQVSQSQNAGPRARSLVHWDRSRHWPHHRDPRRGAYMCLARHGRSGKVKRLTSPATGRWLCWSTSSSPGVPTTATPCCPNSE